MGKYILWAVYLIALCGVLIYSYTQVDLNLTLSSNFLYQRIQSTLTSIGYFNRPLSTLFFLFVTSLLHLCYFGLIYQAKRHILIFSNIIKLVLITALLLLFAYPAFSYDLFNYIFDTRLLIHHHVNPYEFTALDFPDDLWTRFMHWTHRTYPYGPLWLVLTAPFYILGLGKFTLTLIAYKMIGVFSYLLSVWAIKTIMEKTQPKQRDIAVTLFAFNPLIVYEFLVSAHIDSAMAAFLLLSLVWLFQTKPITSALALIFSAGIKFITAILAPLYWLYLRKQISFEKLITFSIMLMYVAVIFVISRREILPWYFITPFALTVLLPKHRLFVYLMVVLTLASLLRYAPFLYFGDYSEPMKQWRDLLFYLTLAVGGIGYLIYRYTSKRKLLKTKTK